MEDTWGSEHLAVLPEDEAQRWILGVGTYHFFFQGQELVLVHPKTFKYFKFALDNLKLTGQVLVPEMNDPITVLCFY